MRPSTSYDYLSNHFASFDRAVTAPLFSSPSMNSFRPFTSFQTARTSLRLKTQQLNKYPIIHSPRRAVELEHNTLTPNLNIKSRQKDIGIYFNNVNRLQRQKTAELLSYRHKLNEPVLEKNDSFYERYDPKNKKFTHKLVGDVKLPRKHFNITPGESENVINVVRKSSPLKNVMVDIRIPQLEGIKIDHSHRKADIRKRALSCLRHLIQLKPNNYMIENLDKMMPKQPYSQAKSKEFIMACKLGNLEEVKNLLHINRWLAHSYDTARQTGLH